MVWSLIATVTALLFAFTLWFTADLLDKKKAVKQMNAGSDNQEDMANYED